MEIAFILSLEHFTLPLAEIESALAAQNMEYIIRQVDEGLILIEIPDTEFADLPGLVRRLSFTHEVFRVLLKTDSLRWEENATNFPWKTIVKENYAVRVKKIDSKLDITSLNLEKGLGGIIKLQTGLPVDLNNPRTFIRTVVTGDKILIGHRISSISKKHFFELKPHKRPFFYPGSMHPKLARAMVNLTRVKQGERLLDPFCGTGGILIEAGIVGAKVIGSDLDPKMVAGTKENLTHCGVDDFEVFRADVRKLKLSEVVDAVATDPPYGISASTGGEKSQDLYQQAMISMEKLLKDEGRMCMATPHYLDIDSVLQGTKFEVIEQHHIRMHKSLTRVISVLQIV
ncbi:MAG TPA: TIGR01177 family methyltransferase [Methanobacteriaceae archaeon]|nr:TIGR01177 family methyltransferase [Methanobacteriaceae archaeon]